MQERPLKEDDDNAGNRISTPPPSEMPDESEVETEPDAAEAPDEPDAEKPE